MTQDGQTGRIVQGQTFREPITLEVPAAEVYVAQKPYRLDGEEFLILTKIKSSLEIASYTLMWGTAILGIGVIAKLIDSYFSEKPSNIERWELITLLIVFTVSSLSRGLNAILPNERKKVSKKIRKHFKENEKVLGIMK